MQESVRFLKGVNNVSLLLFGAFEIDYNESHLSLGDLERQMTCAGFPPEDEMRAVLTSSSIRCSVCAENIENNLRTLDGINSINVDQTKKTIEIDFVNSVISLDDIKSNLKEFGYTPDTY